MKANLKAGTIVVAIEEKQTTCGIRYIHEGSILEVASDCAEWEDPIDIFRNRREKASGNIHWIDRDKLRLATPEEINSFACGDYYTEKA